MSSIAPPVVSTVPPTVPLTIPSMIAAPEPLSEDDCADAAVEAVVPLQAFIEEYEELTIEEWNALDPSPDSANAQDQVTEVAQAAVNAGCDPVAMEEMLVAEIGKLEGDGEVGAALAAAFRGEEPDTTLPATTTTTTPGASEPSTSVVEPGDDLAQTLARIAPGSTVEFAAGAHTFDQPIVVDIDVTFLGAGRDETGSGSNGAETAVRCCGVA